MKRTFLVLLCGLLFTFQIALSSCQQSGELYRLAEPANFVLIDGAIVWDEEPLATGYAVVFCDAETTTAESRFLLPADLADGVYQIEVQSLGDNESYADSEWANFTFVIEEAPDEDDGGNTENGNSPVKMGYDELGLLYTLLSDGSGYEVSRGIAGQKLAGTVTIPETYQGLPVKRIADYAFTINTYNRGPLYEYNTNSITTSIILPSTIEEIGEQSFACLTRVEEFVLPDSVKVIGKAAFWGCTHLKRVNIPYGITEIPANCFMDCALEEIEIPDSVEKIGYGAFEGSEVDTSSLAYLGFPDISRSMQNLKKIVIPDSVKIIENAVFRGCSNLEEITLSENLEWLGYWCFYDTKWLESQPEGSVMIGDIFYGYVGQTPATFTIPETAKKIAGGAFYIVRREAESQSTVYAGANLEEITIPDGVKLIGEYIFNNCKNLTKVRLPSDLTEIPKGCFWNCKSLEKIELPNTLKTVGERAFRTCSALKEITLPNGIEELGLNSFAGCSALEEIVLPHSLKELGYSCFSSATLRIFYEGTEAEWEALKAQHNLYTESGTLITSPFGNATVYYYSDSEPNLNKDGTAYDGNYWHYIDGEIVVWIKETA